MSDEKLSGGGRPESRAKFEKHVNEVGHGFSLVLSDRAERTYSSIYTETAYQFYQLGERDMAERAAQAPELILDSVRKYYEVAAGFENGTLAGHKEIALLNLVAVIGEQTAAWLRALAGVPAEPR
jgi:hypothetical protein